MATPSGEPVDMRHDPVNLDRLDWDSDYTALPHVSVTQPGSARH